MSVDNTQYYAYDNIEGDDFGVGYAGNKEDWIRRINQWNRNEKVNQVRTVDEWEELTIKDFRGMQIAEVVSENGDRIVTWAKDNKESSVKINKKDEVSWLENNTRSTSVPRWMNRLKKTVK